MRWLDITRKRSDTTSKANPTFPISCSFLDLMSSSPASFFVPTLDIDLVWHTHQLFPQRYSSDCEQYVHRFIDQYVYVVLLLDAIAIYSIHNLATIRLRA